MRWLVLLLVAALAACAGSGPGRPSGSAATAGAAQVLAPTGTLRIGVYPGSPTSLLRGPGGDERGITVDLGRALAQRLGVPSRLVEYPRIAAVLDGLKAGEVDFTFTNATPSRAAVARFSSTLLVVESSYLVPAAGKLKSFDDVDRPGVRVGVTEGSSSQAALGQRLKQATLVGAPSLAAAVRMLEHGEIDAYATNKAALYEMADGLPGSVILPGRWGHENYAVAIPITHEAMLAELNRFAEAMRDDGSVRRAADRAGLRGAVTAP